MIKKIIPNEFGSITIAIKEAKKLGFGGYYVIYETASLRESAIGKTKLKTLLEKKLNLNHLQIYSQTREIGAQSIIQEYMLHDYEKIFLIDCDNVLADFSKMIREVIYNKFGINIIGYEKNFDYFEHPLVRPIKETVWEYICQTPDLIKNLSKYEYSDELIAKLREHGRTICLTSVTRSNYYPSERYEWLINNLLFKRKDIILCFEKHLVWGNLFIDDKPSNVISWSNRWKNETAILWKNDNWYQDSREPKPPENIFQTGSVDELFKYLHDVNII